MQCLEEQSLSINAIEQFIKANHYPTFDQMEDIQFRRLDLDAEYGLVNHNYCKKVYETMHLANSKKYVDQWIECVKSGGGSQALKCNAETLRLFSPIAKCLQKDVLNKFQEIYDYAISKL